LYGILGHAKSHFVKEEYIFMQLKYPDIDDHARKHADIIIAISNALDNGDPCRPMFEWIETGMAIKYALVTHFSVEDAIYAKLDYNLSSLQLAKI
jgi:hemerythrin